MLLAAKEILLALLLSFPSSRTLHSEGKLPKGKACPFCKRPLAKGRPWSLKETQGELCKYTESCPGPGRGGEGGRTGHVLRDSPQCLWQCGSLGLKIRLYHWDVPSPPGSLRVCLSICYKGLAHAIMEAEEPHDLPSASWGPRKDGGVIQPESKDLRSRGANDGNPSLKAENDQYPSPVRQKRMSSLFLCRLKIKTINKIT